MRTAADIDHRRAAPTEKKELEPGHSVEERPRNEKKKDLLPRLPLGRTCKKAKTKVIYGGLKQRRTGKTSILKKRKGDVGRFQGAKTSSTGEEKGGARDFRSGDGKTRRLARTKNRQKERNEKAKAAGVCALSGLWGSPETRRDSSPTAVGSKYN